MSYENLCRDAYLMAYLLLVAETPGYSETKHCGRCDAENKADGTGYLCLGIGFSLGLI